MVCINCGLTGGVCYHPSCDDDMDQQHWFLCADCYYQWENELVIMVIGPDSMWMPSAIRTVIQLRMEDNE